MKLEVLNVALEALSQLRPIVARIKRHDRGAHNDLGTRRSRFQTAAGSASEVRVGVLAAVRWGHVSQAQADPALVSYDRVLGMLYKLVHG